MKNKYYIIHERPGYGGIMYKNMTKKQVKKKIIEIYKEYAPFMDKENLLKTIIIFKGNIVNPVIKENGKIKI